MNTEEIVESEEPLTSLNTTLQFYKKYESEFFIARTAYLLTFLVGFLLNVLLLIVLLFVKPARLHNNKSHTVLITNLVTISVGLAFGVLFNTSNAFFLFPVKPSLCQPVAYIKNVFTCAYPLNLLIVIRDHMRPLQMTENDNYWVARVAFTWTVPLLFNIPFAYMGSPKTDPFNETISDGSCIVVNLFGSFSASVTYEVLKFLLFYIFVTVDIVRLIRFIQKKMVAVRHLEERAKQYRRRTRLLYFHLAMFVAYWLPAGFYSGYRHLTLRSQADSHKNSVDTQKFWKPFAIYFGLVMYFYSLLVPLLSYLLFKGKSRMVRHQFRIYKWYEAKASAYNPPKDRSVEKRGFTTCQRSRLFPSVEVKEHEVEINAISEPVSWKINLPKSKGDEERTQDKNATVQVCKIFTPVKEWLI